MASIKVWVNHKDFILSTLCQWLVNRHLLKIKLQNEPFPKKQIEEIQAKAKKKYKLSDKDLNYFAFEGDVISDIYSTHQVRINMLYSDGKVVDITKASDHLNASVLDKKTKKYFLCYPKGL